MAGDVVLNDGSVSGAEINSLISNSHFGIIRLK